MFVFIVHNIYSNVKLNEVIDVYLSFPIVDLLVISKASSAAAQTGVPEAEKRAYLRGRRILYLPDLTDVREVLKLDKLYLIVPYKIPSTPLDFERLAEEIKSIRIGIAIPAGDSTFTARELELGEPVNIGVDEILPPAAYAGIILYSVTSRT